MPIIEFLCRDCGYRFEDIIPQHYDPDHDGNECPHCESKRCEKLFPVTGGYSMNSGPSSVRPKGAGSRPRKAQ